MFLSRLQLNPLTRGVIRDIADPAELHKTVLRGFDTDGARSPREQLGVLHRLDVDRAGGQVVVLVQSADEPDWGRLEPGYLLRADGNPGTKPLDRLFSQLVDGSQWRFRLRANPTRVLTEEGRKKRIELRGDEARAAWLKRQAERLGFDIIDSKGGMNLRIVEEPKVVGFKRVAERAHRMTIKPVLFDGMLRVKEGARFVQAVRQGIGPAKAYGCGLLSLAP